MRRLFQFKQMVIRINETGYSISLVALLLSLGILFHFKSLRCTRITLHMNLFGSFAINNALWLIYFTMVVPNVEVTRNNLVRPVAHRVGGATHMGLPSPRGARKKRAVRARQARHRHRRGRVGWGLAMGLGVAATAIRLAGRDAARRGHSASGT